MAVDGCLPMKPMAPGEQPTEAGWYVARWHDNEIECVRVDAGLCVEGLGVSQVMSDVDRPLDQFTFLARLFLERIEQS